jgi:hypothetical protein
VLNSQPWVWWPGLAAFCFDYHAVRLDVLSEPMVRRSDILEAYQRYVLPIIQHVRGHECLHASAVKGAAGIVLLCGESMNGKTTLAYGLTQRGYTLWADDSVVFDILGGAPRSFPIPFRMHLRSASLSHFGLQFDESIRSAVCSEGGRWAGIAGIFVLERRSDGSNGPVSEISQLTSSEALITLLRHARCFSLRLEERRRQMMVNYLRLVASVPVKRFRYHSRFEDLPTILSKLEEAIARHST